MQKIREKINGLLSELLPQPISFGKRMIAGNPRQPEVIAKLTDKGLIIAPYRAEWTSPSTLKATVLNIDIIGWNELPQDTDQLRAYLSQKIEVARTTRKATYRTCEMCSETNPPEWMHNENTCQSCASDKLGVIY